VSKPALFGRERLTDVTRLHAHKGLIYRAFAAEMRLRILIAMQKVECSDPLSRSY